MDKVKEVVASFYPEVGISGMTCVDGTVEFYSQVNSVIDEDSVVLDFGAGRGAWYNKNDRSFKKKLRYMRGRVARVVGCDVDEAIFENETLDQGQIIEIGARLPFDDAEFDVVVADYVFEHVANPQEVSDELGRILKSGGWICARTPNKYSYISLITKLVKNESHKKLLKWVQPSREEVDVFPTEFLLNSKKDVLKYFSEDSFDHFTYRYEAEPSYFFGNKYMFAFMLLLNRLLPEVFKVNLFIFLRKK